MKKKTLRLLAVFLTIFGCIISFLLIITFVYPQQVNMALNRQLWAFSKPNSYAMEVDFGDQKCTWNVRVTGTQVNTQVSNGQCSSVLQPNEITVEKLFDLAQKWCFRGFDRNCDLEFDPSFHYPKTIAVFDAGFAHITKFSVCDNSIDCKPT